MPKGFPEPVCPFCKAKDATIKDVVGAVTYECGTSWVVYPSAEPRQSEECKRREEKADGDS